MLSKLYIYMGWPDPYTCTYKYGVYTVFLAGRSPNIRSYTLYIYGSANPSCNM